VKFGGLLKTSLIDFPEKIGCVLFLSGCNYACPYCHNPALARGESIRAQGSGKDETDFMEFLEKRKGFLEGVVISGGEPTLQNDLPLLCARIKSMGYAVKIDTNGSRPGMIRGLIRQKLVDYIAMDIKTDPEAYTPLFAASSDAGALLSSIAIIMGSGIDYEFRTTCVRPLVDGQTIEKISTLIQGCRRYVLQAFHEAEILNRAFFDGLSPFYTPAEMEAFQSAARPHVQSCFIRGV